MCQRERPKFGCALGRQMNQDLAPVFRIGQTFDEPGSFQSIGQLHHRVMPQNEPICEFAYGRSFSVWKPFERQQSLMLLGLKVILSGLRFTEVQELPELESKFSQILIVT